MSELCGFVYNKGHQKSRETTREIWRSEGELVLFAIFRDLMSWINGIMALVTSDELAKDVASAEALLDRHQVITYHKYMETTLVLFKQSKWHTFKYTYEFLSVELC